MQRDAEILIDTCVNLAYWMRGGATYDKILWMTPGEKDRMGKFIEKRLAIEKKNPNPVY